MPGEFIVDEHEVIRRCLRIQRFFIDPYLSPDSPVRIEPVAIPWGDELRGNNGHFGWPVATLADGTLIVVYRRGPQHTPRWGVTKPLDSHTGTAFVTRSLDGGRTWSPGIDLRHCICTPNTDGVLDFGNAICTTRSGAVVAVTIYGVFRSRDRGTTWEHLPGAYTARQLPGEAFKNGPAIVEHPALGLLAFAHTADRSVMLVHASEDEGETWRRTTHRLDGWAASIEPAGCYHDGALYLLARAHGIESYEPERGTWRYIQHHSPDGSIEGLKAAFTNIRSTDIRDEISIDGYGPWSQDTAALNFNPVTGRMEAVCTNRCGGGEGREQQRMQMTLNLWSIDPEAFRQGSVHWRFECTLITHAGTMATGSDGMHPGAAVIDTDHGVQRIYVYLGEHLGPAGIFSVTRSLDTPAVRDHCRQRDRHPRGLQL